MRSLFELLRKLRIMSDLTRFMLQPSLMRKITGKRGQVNGVLPQYIQADRRVGHELVLFDRVNAFIRFLTLCYAELLYLMTVNQRSLGVVLLATLSRRHLS